MRTPFWALTPLCLALVACSGDDGGRDGSTFIPRDGGPADTGETPDPDTGVAEDAGFEDAGFEDAGFEDTGVMPDAGFEDTGVEPDAGFEDTGVMADAGAGMDAMTGDAAADAGPPADAGFPDSGATDAGATDAGTPALAYTIDGDLSDWANPILTLTNPGFGGAGLFGPDNRFQEIRVDGDANYLYLGYRFRASGNSCIVHMDTQPGGELSSAMFDAWPRLANFSTPIDHFVAQFEGQSVQFRDVAGTTSAPLSGATIFEATTSNGAQRVTEVAIPWSGLGLAGVSPRNITFYGGVYGGDNFGAGDIMPNASSTPSVPGNTIDQMNSFTVTFLNGLNVSLP